MNFRLVANITSYVLWVEAGFLLLPLAVSVFSGEAWLPFFITAVLCILIGGALHLVPVKNRKDARAGRLYGRGPELDRPGP